MDRPLGARRDHATRTLRHAGLAHGGARLAGQADASRRPPARSHAGRCRPRATGGPAGPHRGRGRPARHGNRRGTAGRAHRDAAARNVGRVGRRARHGPPPRRYRGAHREAHARPGGAHAGAGGLGAALARRGSCNRLVSGCRLCRSAGGDRRLETGAAADRETRRSGPPGGRHAP